LQNLVVSFVALRAILSMLTVPTGVIPTKVGIQYKYYLERTV